PMPAILAHYRAALTLDIVANCAADIKHVIIRADRRDTSPQCLLRDLQKMPCRSIHGSYRHGDGGIAMPAVHDGAKVDGDDVAVFQCPPPGNPMHDLIIYGGADDSWERRNAHRRTVSLEVGSGSARLQFASGNCI